MSISRSKSNCPRIERERKLFPVLISTTGPNRLQSSGSVHAKNKSPHYSNQGPKKRTLEFCSPLDSIDRPTNPNTANKYLLESPQSLCSSCCATPQPTLSLISLYHFVSRLEKLILPTNQYHQGGSYNNISSS